MDKVNDLLERYANGNCSPVEELQIEDWLNTCSKSNGEWQVIDETKIDGWLLAQLSLLNEKIVQAKQDFKKHESFKLKRGDMKAVAKSFGLLVFITVFVTVFVFKIEERNKIALSLTKNDIKAGDNKAYLTLANNNWIALTKSVTGAFAEDAGVKIVKLADGQLIYEAPSAKQSASLILSKERFAFNTIETPKGAQFQITLSDGSKIWLNAGSTLKYPVNLTTAKERKVELKGEAYFEIVRNQARPFVVSTVQQEVSTSDAHFNIKAYNDGDKIKTTLLKGSVKVIALSSHSVVLKPDQQAVCAEATFFKVVPANVEDDIAWKNDYFLFTDESLDNIMKTISRWYNVQVIFKDDLQNKLFMGVVISKSKSISAVLHLLQEKGNIRFKIEGKSVIVMR